MVNGAKVLPVVQDVQLRVEPDLSGGVRVSVGERVFVLSPDDAVRFAAAILGAAGCDVQFDNPGTPVLRRL